ncbi:MAG: chloride channel protein [Cyanobacteriota bacterium]|nr:chloride channel protein [Cyanobacteriota bacterium]
MIGNGNQARNPRDWQQQLALRQLLAQRWLAVGLALACTGLAATSAVLLFKLGIDAVGSWRIRLLSRAPDWLVLPGAGAAGGLAAGLLISGLAPAAAGSGITQVMLFLRKRGVPIGLRVALVKLLAGIAAIGSGFPLGPSGPSIQMGSSMGWSLARLLQAPKAFTRVIVAAGGGAGIAAVFNAPIGGFFYAMEALLRGARPMVMLIVLAVTFWADIWGDLLALVGLGVDATPLLRTGALELKRSINVYVHVLPLDLLLLFGLGGLVALVAEAYCRLLVQLQALSNRWRQPLAVKLALTGAVLGCSDALLPDAFVNEAGIRLAVATGEIDVGMALGVAAVLFLSTSLAAAVGAPGGLFAPMLTLGGALGLVAVELVELTGMPAPDTAVFAGMGAFLAATARTPITALFLVFALSKQWLLLKPVLSACLGSTLVARLLARDSLFERLLRLAPASATDPCGSPPGPQPRSVPLRPQLHPGQHSETLDPPPIREP